jgi:tetratricopeptide (TPR) repeat protein
MALSYNYEYPAYAYWNRGACYYDQYKFKEAEEDYIKAIDRMSDTEDLSILYKQRGDCQAQLGNYETAHSLFARAITYNAKNYKAYWQRGYYKVSEYKYEDGLADYTKALEIINTGGTNATTNEIALLHRNKAILYQNLMQYDNAIVAINKSIETDPNYSRSYRTRAEIYKDLKKYDKARADYENAITLQTDKKMRSDIYLDRSMMAWNILDFKSCLDDLNKAIEADPGDGMNYWHRSMLYGYKKNYPLAIKDCNSAMELYKKDSSSTASLIWLRAEHQDHSGDFKGAVEDFQVYLKYYPDSYSGYYELGRLFKWKMKNNDLADANLSKALVLAEKYVDTVKVAYIKMVRGNKEEALKMMQEVVALTSENNKYDYKWNLHSMSCMYALAGNTVKAFEFLDKSLKAGFDDYRHLITDRDLISLMPLPQWKTILATRK